MPNIIHTSANIVVETWNLMIVTISSEDAKMTILYVIVAAVAV